MTEQSIATLKPAARLTDLVTSEVGDEVLVYDQKSHHIHHLNQTSAVIWRLCDGTRTIADLATATGSELRAAVDENTVQLALAKLSDANLLEQPIAEAARGSLQSRRKLLRRAAIAGAGIAAVPAIASITAPSAAAAGSATCTGSCTALDLSGCSCTCNGDVVEATACVNIDIGTGLGVCVAVCVG